MQEVKFQAWDGEMMHEVAELVWCNGPNLDGKGLKFYGPGVGTGWIDGKSIILRQFTGLYDDKNHEIYDGDIIQIGFDERHQVYSSYGAFMVTDIGYLNALGHPKITGRVIGNIYQNPDLIEAI